MGIYTEKDFNNRELSWIEFNKRVLSEAETEDNPLLERLKFLAIVSSNFDEFFKVRIANLKIKEKSIKENDISGLLPKEQLNLIRIEILKIIDKQYKLYFKLMETVEIEGNINIKKYQELTDGELNYVENYYNEKISPVLIPMAIDSFRPFPFLNNGMINLILQIKEKDNISFAIIEIPKNLERLVNLPSYKKFILVEEVIKNNLKNLFKGYEVLSVDYFRVTRNENIEIEGKNEINNFLFEIEKKIKKRKIGSFIRVEYDNNISNRSLEFLKEQIKLDNKYFYSIAGPLDLTFLWKLMDINGVDNLKFTKNIPKYYKEFTGENIFKILSNRNILLKHPYESYQHVIDLLKISSEDSKVLAIKQTLYRVSSESPIIEYLKKAVENGKQVTVLVELKARFDEEKNIKWAKELEEAGCHVIYGLKQLKTHSKCLLIIRREEGRIKRYLHLGTGNYNDSTAKMYIDYSFFTGDEDLAEDINDLFNKLTGFSKIDSWKKLIAAPTHLRNHLYNFIDREIKNISKGGIGNIIIKVNGLTDRGIIEKLYDASKAGVEIILIVRGVCCLKSGIEGLSENIKVYSLVGRFLEHDRVYFFKNNGKNELFLGSADCMKRNLDGRIETIFPLEKLGDKNKVIESLNRILIDNPKLRIQNKDGSYSLVFKKNKIVTSKLNYEEYNNIAIAQRE